MTAKIYNFSNPRGRDAASVSQSADVQSNEEIFMDTYNDVIYDWESHARRNRLNEFIHSRVSLDVYVDPSADLAGDLNALSDIEQRLHMITGVFSPNSTKNNPFGWLAAFYTDDDIFATPPDMASEATARAMNILLFISYERHLKSLGRR